MKLQNSLVILSVLFLAACTPKVEVQAPDEPIEINLNIKIEQEVRVRVERDLEHLFEEEDELFGISKEEE